MLVHLHTGVKFDALYRPTSTRNRINDECHHEMSVHTMKAQRGDLPDSNEGDCFATLVMTSLMTIGLKMDSRLHGNDRFILTYRLEQTTEIPYAECCALVAEYRIITHIW